MKITRNLLRSVKSDLKEKIVMIGGPRQVGKTTFAQTFITTQNQYLNRDFLEDREKIKKHQIDPQLKIIILDEIPDSIKNPMELLLKFGGFPGPFLKKSKAFHRRWQRERLSRVVYQDIKDLNNLKEIGLLELLVDALPQRVGPLLSIKSLSEDLQVSPNTVARWIEILEQIYYCYRIVPFGTAKIRAVKKAQKLNMP